MATLTGQGLIQVTAATYAAAVATPDLLTYYTGPEIEPVPPQLQSHHSQILNPLYYSGNSQ